MSSLLQQIRANGILHKSSVKSVEKVEKQDEPVVVTGAAATRSIIDKVRSMAVKK